jgi:hypothetical protein
VDLCNKYLNEGVIDPDCKEQVPRTSLMLVRDVAEAILTGDVDPLVPIRQLHMALGKWTLAESLEDIEGPSDDELDDINDEFGDEYDDYDGDDARAEADFIAEFGG